MPFSVHFDIYLMSARLFAVCDLRIKRSDGEPVIVNKISNNFSRQHHHFGSFVGLFTDSVNQ